MAVFVRKKFSQLLDVVFGTPSDGDVPTFDALTGKLVMSPGGGGGAPSGPAGGVLSGTYPNPGFAVDMATQTELDAGVASAEAFATSAVAALSGVYQPLDSDLTAIAALSTTSYGRAFLALADAAAARSALSLGSAATHPSTDFDSAGAAAAAQAASQPLDSDLTAIAALATTSFGRSVLALADAAALRSAAGLGTAATHADTDFDAAGAAAAAQAASQPLDSDLTAIAALTTTSFGRALLALADAAALRTDAGLVIGTDVEAHDADLTAIAALSPTNDDVIQRKAGAWTNRTVAQLLADLAAVGTTFQPLDSDLTSIAALSTTSYGRAFLALADAAAGRTALGLGTLATQSGTFSGTSSGTNTGDQTSVSGNAGTATALATARNIDGQAFDGTANITVIAPGTHAATSKTTPVDADELPIVDSGASNVLKKLTWANAKATLKTYFDTLYTAAGASAPPNGSAGGDLTGSYPNPTLAAAGPGATGPIGDATHSAAVTIDAKGRVTALSSVAITAPSPSMARSARSSNTILGASDKGQVIAATAAFTQTFTAAATLGAGWWVIVKNDTTDGTTVLVLDPNSSETIDGLTTATMYSGETRLVECDGNNFFSQMLKGGYAKFTPTGGNFIVPAGIEQLDVVCVGSGGQGGGGASSVAASKGEGGGGGGGSVTQAKIRGSDVTAGATVTVTVAAGGTGSGGPGANGANGSSTSFGTLLKAYGGGGGGAGVTATNVVGGGGASTVASAATVTAGAPTSSQAVGGQGGGAGAATPGNPAEWGGAGGGGGTGTPQAGGGSIYGGPGGGCGGSFTTTTGAAGGTTQNYGSGGGAGGGAGGASPATGSNGTFTGPYCGTGGGGGGGTAVAATNGAAGGVGGIGAGGGGGGAATGTGGTGGAGGAGECRVWYS